MKLLALVAFCSIAVLTCADNWGSFERDYCVGDGLRQYSSALHGIPFGESWESHCANSPQAVVEGQTFERPSRCVNVGPDIVVRGHFDVKDVSCESKEDGAANHLEHARSLRPSDKLYDDMRLDRGHLLMSQNGRFHLDMQADGNLVLYRTADNQAIWYTNTWGWYPNTYGYGNPAAGGSYAIKQNDGNFIVYGSGRRALWSSRTNTRGGNFLQLQDDGNLVIYTQDTNVPQWSTGTGGMKMPTNLRSESLTATHVANSSAMTMQGAEIKKTK